MSLTPIPLLVRYDFLVKHQQGRERMSPPWSRGSALLVLALGLTLLAPSSPRRESTAGEEDSAILAGGRWVEPRLIGSSYVACGPVTDPDSLIPEPSCRDGRRKIDSAWLKLGQQIEAEAERRPDAASLRRLALWNLLAVAGEKGADRAVVALERATALVPREARLWSDLAAAYLVRGQRRDAPADLVAALQSVQRAVSLQPALPEARFNYALILESLYLWEEARAEWLRYRALDSESGWGVEAMKRRWRLRSRRTQEREPAAVLRTEAALSDNAAGVHRLVRRDPVSARQEAESRLADWATAWGQGSRGLAERHLKAARTLGVALAAESGERLVLQGVAAVDQALSEQDLARLDQLAEGYQLLREGRKRYEEHAVQSAMPSLQRAKDLLEKARSPLAEQAAFYLACCDHYCRRHDRVAEGLEKLRGRLGDLPYLNLRGQLEWMTGLSALTRGEPYDAVSYYRRSLALFERGGDADSAARTRVLIAESLGLLGAREESWNEMYRALRMTPDLRSSRALIQVFMVAADLGIRQGRWEAALLFENEMLRLADRSRDLALTADALFWRGLILDQLGESAEAAQDLRRAREFIVHVDETLRQRLTTDIDLVEGSVLSRSDPGAAIPLLTRALAVYETTQSQFQAVLAYRSRARAYRLLGDMAAVERDLKSAVDFYARLGNGLFQEEVHLTFLRQTTGLLDEMIAFQALERGRADRAFEYADLARTRVLPALVLRLSRENRPEPRLLSEEPRPLPLREMQRRLPIGTSLIQFSVLPDQVLVWVIGREDFRQIQRPIPQEELDRWIARLDPEAAAEGWETSAADLYDLLIRPSLTGLPKGERIVFVPDKSLHAVPFACLKDRATGRLLIQDREVSVAPSASLYCEMIGRARALASTTVPDSVLAVGNPAFDLELFPHLSNLPDAEAEAAVIAGLYPKARLRTRKEATRAEFLRQLAAASLVHFGGHALLNRQNPLQSALLLAPDAGGGSAGLLTALDIYRLDLKQTRLAVLASCKSGWRNPGDEGGGILARAFFAAGVPTVMASLWEVDDRASARLLREFHGHLVRGKPPAEALREAQLSMLSSGHRYLSNPSIWGAFQVIGASGG